MEVDGVAFLFAVLAAVLAVRPAFRHRAAARGVGAFLSICHVCLLSGILYGESPQRHKNSLSDGGPPRRGLTTERSREQSAGDRRPIDGLGTPPFARKDRHRG